MPAEVPQEDLLAPRTTCDLLVQLIVRSLRSGTVALLISRLIDRSYGEHAFVAWQVCISQPACGLSSASHSSCREARSADGQF